MIFHAQGHPNILATHKTTIEFTKEKEVTKKGDCIVGVKADFDSRELHDFANKHAVAQITMTVGSYKETILAQTNPEFNDDREFVVRMGEHASPRTFATRADRAAKYLNREMIELIKKREKIEVRIEAAKQE